MYRKGFMPTAFVWPKQPATIPGHYKVDSLIVGGYIHSCITLAVYLGLLVSLFFKSRFNNIYRSWASLVSIES